MPIGEWTLLEVSMEFCSKTEIMSLYGFHSIYIPPDVHDQLKFINPFLNNVRASRNTCIGK